MGLNFSIVFSFTLLPNFVLYARIELRSPLLNAPHLIAWPAWPRQLEWNLSFSLKTVALRSLKIKISKKYATLSDSVGIEPRSPGLTVENVYHYTTDLMFKVLLCKYLRTNYSITRGPLYNGVSSNISKHSFNVFQIIYLDTFKNNFCKSLIFLSCTPDFRIIPLEMPVFLPRNLKYSTFLT